MSSGGRAEACEGAALRDQNSGTDFAMSGPRSLGRFSLFINGFRRRNKLNQLVSDLCQITRACMMPLVEARDFLAGAKHGGVWSN